MLFLVQKKEELETVVSFLKKNIIDYEVVAFTPEVIYYANQINFPVIDIEHFINWKLLNKIGDNNYIKVNQICNHLDQIIKPFISCEEFYKHISFHNFYNDIKGFLDSFCIRYYQLNSLFSKLKHKEICLFEFNDVNISGSNIFDKSPFFFIPRISIILAKYLGKQCYLIKGFKKSKITIIHKNTLFGKDFPPMNLDNFLIENLKTSLFNIKNNYKNLFFENINNDKSIFIHNTNITSVTEHLRNHYSNTVEIISSKCLYLNKESTSDFDSSISKFLDYIIAVIHNDKKFHNFFCFDHYQFWIVFRTFFKILCQHNLRRSLKASPFLFLNLNTLAKRKTKTKVLLGGLTDINKLLVHICRDIGIKTSSIHYGSGSGFLILPMYERYDLLGADYFICGGPKSKKTLSIPSLETKIDISLNRATPYPLGLPWTDDLIKRTKSLTTKRNNNKILVIPSEYFGDNRYLGYLFPPDNVLHETNMAMLNTLTNLTNYKFYFKPKLKDRFNGIINPIIEHIKAFKFKNIYIINKNIDVEQIIHEYDGIISTCPGTPMQYALSAKIPSLILAEKLYYKIPNFVLHDTRMIFDIHLDRNSFLKNISNFCIKTSNFKATSNELDQVQFNYINPSNENCNSVKKIADFILSNLK